MASESTRISIKLLIDQERNKVILSEAGNDFVDTLRTILMFPLGSIPRLFCKLQIPEPGCLINLYNRVENLNTNICRTHAYKYMLLYPRTVHENRLKKMKLNMDLRKVDEQGCFWKVISFNSFISWESRIFHHIKEEVLEIDSYEMSNLLSYSLVSKTTLTDAFLRKQRILSGEKSLLVVPNMEETVENDVKTNSKKAVLQPFYSCPKEFPSICSEVRFSSFLDPESPNPNSSFSSGYVLKNSSFLVADDLVVKSLSSVSIISVLKKSNILLVDVEQQVISIGQVFSSEGTELLFNTRAEYIFRFWDQNSLISSPQNSAPDFFQPFSPNQASIHLPFIFISSKVRFRFFFFYFNPTASLTQPFLLALPPATFIPPLFHVSQLKSPVPPFFSIASILFMISV
ncbi:hypothetical protein GOBAR_AA22387 [Gossypium barbadense]|uniref:Uncharacterized protein n=1 Tax=Gossypium barbadense TaxID=3634 RepID=A0A2P5X4Q7_GOSBA|nr:hypothetical protein GOBAR_AA22387 [Gossypium barbadense]